MKKSLILGAGLLAASLSSLAHAGGIQVGNSIPFAAETVAPEAVRKECGLEAGLPAWIAEASKGAVAVTEKPSGKVLTARITHVLAPGGGPFSGPKSVSVEGEIKEGGKVVASFQGRRSTTRGGYGTCSMLQVAGKVLGEDIAKWAAEPSLDAKLGEVKK